MCCGCFENRSSPDGQEKGVSPARRRLSALSLVQDRSKECRSAFQSLQGMIGSEFLSPAPVQLLEAQHKCLEQAIACIKQCIELEAKAFGGPEALPAAEQAPGPSAHPVGSGPEKPAFRMRDDPLAWVHLASSKNDRLMQELDPLYHALKAMTAAWSQDPAFIQKADGSEGLLRKQDDLLASSTVAVGRARELALTMKELLADTIRQLEAQEKTASEPDTFLLKRKE